jgi:hypothetical protein
MWKMFCDMSVYIKKYEQCIKSKKTTHNRTAYASGPCGPSASAMTSPILCLVDGSAEAPGTIVKTL